MIELGCSYCARSIHSNDGMHLLISKCYEYDGQRPEARPSNHFAVMVNLEALKNAGPDGGASGIPSSLSKTATAEAFAPYPFLGTLTVVSHSTVSLLAECGSVVDLLAQRLSLLSTSDT